MPGVRLRVRGGGRPCAAQVVFDALQEACWFAARPDEGGGVMRDTLDMARFAIRLALEDGVSGRALTALVRQEQRSLQNQAARSVRGDAKPLREAA